MSRLRGLWKVVFGRTMILIVLMLVQAFVLFGGFVILDREVWFFNYMFGFLAVIILMYIVNVRQNSSFKFMWIILIIAFPVLGVTFYLYTRLQPGTRFISRRVREIIDEEEAFLKPADETVRKICEASKAEAGLFKYIHDEGNYPVYDNASVKYFPLGEDKFKELIYQLERAQDFIFLEYFIVERGHMWNTVLGILLR